MGPKKWTDTAIQNDNRMNDDLAFVNCKTDANYENSWPMSGPYTVNMWSKSLGPLACVPIMGGYDRWKFGCQRAGGPGLRLSLYCP